MPRSLWSGAISFGLLNIPVSLLSAKEGEASVAFSLLDKRDYGRIGYKQYNKKTGKEVPKREIVKGFEYEPDHFVVVTDKDFERANPKASHAIEIEDFVELDDVDLFMFEKPYYLIPAKYGEKGYVLLRKVMEKTRKVAIGQIVLHKKQLLVAIMARGDYLICEVLRYAREVIQTSEIKELKEKIRNIEVSKRELDVATQLVEGMTSKWQPDKYHDTYYDDLMKRIQAKVKSGGAIESEELNDEPISSGNIVLDLMPLLKKSLEAAASTNKKTTKNMTRRKSSAIRNKSMRA
jgi:DNA end-binding protein Ku